MIGAALTAGALLLAPAAAVVAAAPDIAYAAPPGGGPGNPGSPGGTPTPPPSVTKQVFHLPFLKIEIKNVQGQTPKIKFVPFPKPETKSVGHFYQPPVEPN